MAQISECRRFVCLLQFTLEHAARSLKYLDDCVILGFPDHSQKQSERIPKGKILSLQLQQVAHGSLMTLQTYQNYTVTVLSLNQTWLKHHPFDSYWLVVWNLFYFPICWESSSQLTFIFFRGVAQPPTRLKFPARKLYFLGVTSPAIARTRSFTAQHRSSAEWRPLGRDVTFSTSLDDHQGIG